MPKLQKRPTDDVSSTVPLRIAIALCMFTFSAIVMGIAFWRVPMPWTVIPVHIVSTVTYTVIDAIHMRRLPPRSWWPGRLTYNAFYVGICAVGILLMVRYLP